MASANVLSIWNRSLGGIGARSSVQSQNENSPQANACNLYYQSTFESIARTALWNCLLKQQKLTLVAAAAGTPENPQGTTLPLPPVPWRYAYLLPADCLYVRQLLPPPILPQPTTNGVPMFPPELAPLTYGSGRRVYIPYQVSSWANSLNQPQQVILTDLRDALCNYTTNQPNPQQWDSLFQTAMVASLGVFLASSLTGDKALVNMQVKIAEQAIAQARTRDATEEPNSQDREAEWIAARNGSGIYSEAYGGNAGYENMIWPG
jgi:hypothetical protein